MIASLIVTYKIEDINKRSYELVDSSNSKNEIDTFFLQPYCYTFKVSFPSK